MTPPHAPRAQAMQSAEQPPWGRALRAAYSLDPDFNTVNHGSFGATPLAVQQAQDAWRARMERQPTRFVVQELPMALRQAAAAVAGFVAARPDDLAFVENATTGCNAVLRSIRLRPGDEVIVLDHGYGAVVKAARHEANQVGASIVEVAVPFPPAGPADRQQAAMAAALDAGLAAALGPRTRLAVLDHITSPSALLLPAAAMVATCHAAGVPVLLDGAHAPGNIPLDVPAIGADWYVGNCHKWLSAPKGCGFLWAAPARQAGLHPTTISHGLGDGFLAEFDWTGTRDMSAYLSVTAALDWHARLGGAALRARNAALAEAAARTLATQLGTEAVITGHSMSLVRLPLANRIDASAALTLRKEFLELGTDVPVTEIAGQAWLRLSVAPYNDMSDFQTLAEIVMEHLSTLCVSAEPQPS